MVLVFAGRCHAYEGIDLSEVVHPLRTGIAAGWGSSLRDVTITGNLVRGADVGIAVSVAPEAGTVLITDNLIADVKFGAIVGKEWDKTVTGDLSKDGAGRYAQLSIDGNRVR